MSDPINPTRQRPAGVEGGGGLGDAEGVQVTEWRPVVGFEGLYAVSTEGQVRSTPRQGTAGGILVATFSRCGYPTVGLARAGKKKQTHAVHRLVARAFLGPRPRGREVRHLNGDCMDSRLVNLVYGTRSQNALDKLVHGTDPNSRKTHCKQGHRYDEENTRTYGRRRYCKSCETDRTTRRAAARIAARAAVLALVLTSCSARPAAAVTSTIAGPTTAAGWQALYDGLPFQGDGMFSTGLPDGRSVWVTGDARPITGGTWASNTVTVVDGTGSWQTPNVLPDVDGVKSWLGPVAVVDGKLVALVSRVRHVDAWPGFEPVGTAIATMRLGAGEWWPTLEQVTATPWADGAVNWTAGLYVYCGYAYIFGTRQIPGTPSFDVYLARVPTAQLHTVSAWRFWVGPGRWTTGTPAPVLTAGTDSAFSVRRDGAGWRLYTRHGDQHGEFVGYPGRWSWRPRGTEGGYLPASHPEVRLASGRLLVTLNVPGTGARFLEV